MDNPRLIEIEFYKRAGKHPERIYKEQKYPYHEYVIGDWSWNKRHPKKQEKIEHKIPYRLSL